MISSYCRTLTEPTSGLPGASRGSAGAAAGIVASTCRGDVIGRCGNSGNAGTPHLHVGLLSSIDPISTRRMVFSDYEVVGPDLDWHPGDGTPRKNQLMRRLVTR